MLYIYIINIFNIKYIRNKNIKFISQYKYHIINKITISNKIIQNNKILFYIYIYIFIIKSYKK